MFISVIKHVQKEVPTGTGMAVYLSSNGNIIGSIFLSHHLTPIYCSVSHFKFNSFFSYLHVPTLPSETYMYSSTPPPPLQISDLTHSTHSSAFQPVSTCIIPALLPKVSYHIHTYIHIAIAFPKRGNPKKEKGIAKLCDI